METFVTGAHEVSVEVFQDIDAISHEAARIFISVAERFISSHGRFTVAISGGSTPIKLFTILGSWMYSDKIDWSRVHFFWVDERCVPKEHKNSNFGGAWDSLLSNVPIPKTNIHRVKGEMPPSDAALAYEDELKSFFCEGRVPELDLIFLGMGEEGHTASLFPDSDSLKESERLAVPVYVEKLKSWRVTLTLPVLNNARHVVFLVTGKNKSTILKEILENRNGKYPAALIKPNDGSLTWLVDEDAAKEIK